MRPLLFRVNVSAQIGMGHLMRSLALAQAAEHYDIPSHFIVDDGGKALAVARQDWVYPVTEVTGPHQDGAWLLAQAQKLNASAVVVDGYHIPAEELAGLKQQGIPVILMDDGQLSQVKMASLIANSTTTDFDDKYRALNPQATLCTGPAFRLMRREFREGGNPPMDQRYGIAICIGGSDPKGITAPLIKALSNALTDVPVRVVTGPAFSQDEALREAINTSSLPLQHIHNCQDMADVWRHAKLAVSAAGGSQFELGICETPSVLLMVAENQRHATQQAAGEGWCQTFDCTGTPPIADIASTVASLWQKPSQLESMHQALIGRYAADGAERVLEVIAGVVNQ